SSFTVTEDASEKPSSWSITVRQILCVRLKNWLIDRWKRSCERSGNLRVARELARGPARGTASKLAGYTQNPVRRWTTSMCVKPPQPRLPSAPPVPKVSSPKNLTDPPIVLVRTVASRQIIVAVNDSARHYNIHSEMTLAEARAICADVRH